MVEKECPHCAEKVPDSAAYCGSCGKPLRQNPVDLAERDEPMHTRPIDEVSSWDEYLEAFRALPTDEQLAEWNKLSFRQRYQLRTMIGLDPADPPRRNEYSGASTPDAQAPGIISARQIVGYAGCAALIGGVFAPLVAAQSMGSVSYLDNGFADGIFIICASLLAFLVIRRQAYVLLWLPILIAAGLMALAYSRLAEDTWSIDLQWGGAVLCAGLLLLVATAIGGSSNSSRA